MAAGRWNGKDSPAHDGGRNSVWAAMWRAGGIDPACLAANVELRLAAQQLRLQLPQAVGADVKHRQGREARQAVRQGGH